jgi:hypothetical protein
MIVVFVAVLQCFSIPRLLSLRLLAALMEAEKEKCNIRLVNSSMKTQPGQDQLSQRRKSMDIQSKEWMGNAGVIRFDHLEPCNFACSKYVSGLCIDIFETRKEMQLTTASSEVISNLYVPCLSYQFLFHPVLVLQLRLVPPHRRMHRRQSQACHSLYSTQNRPNYQGSVACIPFSLNGHG